MKPVLDTIRELLKFKRSTTIPEVARYCNKKPREVLEIINRNAKFIIRDRNRSGKIYGTSCRSALSKRWFEEGRFWREHDINYGAAVALDFEAHSELKKKLEEPYTSGGLGDNCTSNEVLETDANIRALRDEGMCPASEIVLDDELWDEEDEPDDKA